MEIVSYCPECYASDRFRSEEAPESRVCSRCGLRREVRISESVRDGNVVDRCVLCGCGHLYIEKDVNGYLGLAVIVVAILVSLLLWARNVYASVGVLGAAALLDWVVWNFARERTVCYRCVARYRGARPNPAHGRYGLGIAGRFADDYDEQRRLHQK